MASDGFCLVFAGEVTAESNPLRVRDELAKLFKKPPEALAAIFDGSRHVLKAADSAKTLEPMREAFARVGAIAHIEPARPQAKLVPKAQPQPQAQPGPATASPQARYSLAEFVAATRERERGEGVFELEGPRMLEINLDGQVWMKMGAMVAYRGDMKFTREGILDKGAGKLLKKFVSGEGAKLTKVQGTGSLYVADTGKKITILKLENQAIVVNGNDVLAFESQIDWDIRMMKRISSMLAGGLFNMRLSGTGMIAITTHYDPLTLEVDHGKAAVTDPNATVAWSDSLEPRLKTDVSLKTFVGRGSGESIQLEFEGKGFVVIQPYEETYLQRGQ